MGGLLYVTVPRLVHLNGKRKNRSKRFPHDENQIGMSFENNYSRCARPSENYFPVATFNR